MDEVKNYIKILKNNIAEASVEQRLLGKELDRLVRDIDSFLEVYLANILSSTKPFKPDIGAYQNKEQDGDSEDDVSQHMISQRSVVKADELKNLYHKLVKECHPDLKPSDPDAKLIFHMVQEAYSAGDIKKMVQIERSFSVDLMLPDNEIEALENLEREYDILLNSVDKLRIQMNKLKNSKEYKLYCQFYWAKICGKDLYKEAEKNLELA